MSWEVWCSGRHHTQSQGSVSGTHLCFKYRDANQHSHALHVAQLVHLPNLFLGLQVGSPGNSSTECLCPIGYYLPQGHAVGSACVACPDNAKCDGDKWPDPGRGVFFWREEDVVFRSGNMLYSIYVSGLNVLLVPTQLHPQTSLVPTQLHPQASLVPTQLHPPRWPRPAVP